ncbi:protein of unknown function-containing protein [Forsythia ovata]|uniref:MCM N-terminal domain-containing protein n=1 Tax=Forsythia ovata TaxID=205694 RepID=A0ABD1W5Q8_9LAMI
MRPNKSNTMFIDFSHVMRFNDVLQKAISNEFLRFKPYLKNACKRFVLVLKPTFIDDDNPNKDINVAFYNLPLIKRISISEQETKLEAQVKKTSTPIATPIAQLTLATLATFVQRGGVELPAANRETVETRMGVSIVDRRLKSINFYRSQDAHPKKVADSDALFNLGSSDEAQNFEAQSQYFFQPSPQESFQENLETTQAQTHYIFQQDLHKTQAHLIFEEEKVTHLDFQEVREQKAEKNELQSMDEVCSELTGSHFIRTKSDTEPASGEIPVKLPARMRKSASLKSAFGHFEEDIVEAQRPASAREKGNRKLSEDHEVDAKADDFINKFKQQLKLQRLNSIIGRKK